MGPENRPAGLVCIWRSIQLKLVETVLMAMISHVLRSLWQTKMPQLPYRFVLVFTQTLPLDQSNIKILKMLWAAVGVPWSKKQFENGLVCGQPYRHHKSKIATNEESFWSRLLSWDLTWSLKRDTSRHYKLGGSWIGNPDRASWTLMNAWAPTLAI